MPFRSVVGHARLTSLLSRAVQRETLPPALLFAGPSGVGKRLVAMAIAEALNCLDPVSSDACVRDGCGVCAACRRIARLVHPDVIVVTPSDTGTIKVDQVREVIERAGYRPFEGRRRVVIIDDADAMLPGAQNALLKTLEEPPSASTFILVSSMPDSLLSTVRSRCPRLRFGTLSPDEVATVLVRDHQYEAADARAVAADADGSIGRALSAASADLVDARATAAHVLEQTARLSDPARRIEVAKDFSGAKSSSASERDQLSACLRALASLLRDVGVLTVGGNADGLANADLRDLLDRVAPVFEGARGVRAYGAVDRALAALERNASPKVVADWLVLEL